MYFRKKESFFDYCEVIKYGQKVIKSNKAQIAL